MYLQNSIETMETHKNMTERNVIHNKNKRAPDFLFKQGNKTYFIVGN